MADFLRHIETVEASINVRLNKLKKYNITLGNTRTSVTLEPFIWDVLLEVAKRQDVDVHSLCEFINKRKGSESNLASAIRVFLISYLYTKLKNGDA